MHYSKFASVIALVAAAVPAAALPVQAAANFDSAPAALEARFLGPSRAAGPGIIRAHKKAEKAIKQHDIRAKNTPPKPKKPTTAPKQDTTPTSDKRDLQEEEAELEVRALGGPSAAAGPGIVRAHEKAHKAVKMYEAMAKNTPAKPGKPVKPPTAPKKQAPKPPKKKGGKRDLQEEEAAATLEARYLGPSRAAGPGIVRAHKKAQKAVKMYDAMAKNTPAKPGKPVMPPTAPKKKNTKPPKSDKRDLQQGEEADEQI